MYSVIWHRLRLSLGKAVAADEFGDLILDEYQLQLPADAPPGEYSIEVGLYDPVVGSARAMATSPAGQDHLILGTVRVR